MLYGAAVMDTVAGRQRVLIFQCHMLQSVLASAGSEVLG